MSDTKRSTPENREQRLRSAIAAALKRWPGEPILPNGILVTRVWEAVKAELDKEKGD